MVGHAGGLKGHRNSPYQCSRSESDPPKLDGSLVGVKGIGMMESKIMLSVVLLAEQHGETWRDKSESVWFAGLIEEVAELGQSLVGKHEHPPETELYQIAAICMNWLDMRQNP